MVVSMLHHLWQLPEESCASLATPSQGITPQVAVHLKSLAAEGHLAGWLVHKSTWSMYTLQDIADSA